MVLFIFFIKTKNYYKIFVEEKLFNLILPEIGTETK